MHIGCKIPVKNFILKLSRFCMKSHFKSATYLVHNSEEALTSLQLKTKLVQALKFSQKKYKKSRSVMGVKMN